MTTLLTRAARGGTAVWLALVAAACTASPVDPAPSGGTVIASAAASRIAITNQTSAPVFTFTVGARTAALINWAPCVDAAQCPPLAPNATVEAPYPAAAEQGAIVYRWHAVRGGDGALRPDSVRAIYVGL